MNLEFAYELENEEIDTKKYLNEEGNLPFNSNSKSQMKVMMQEICATLSLNDEYSKKKLEVCLRYELPSFTANRKLVKNWVVNNFMY